jgi:hypothetical protein
MKVTLTDKKDGRLLMCILVRGQITSQGRRWFMSNDEKEALLKKGRVPGPKSTAFSERISNLP